MHRQGVPSDGLWKRSGVGWEVRRLDLELSRWGRHAGHYFEQSGL